VAVTDLSVRRLRNAALGTALVFWVSGFVLATWVSRLPAVRDRLGADPAELGFVLFAPGLGSLVSMPATGWLCRRFGTRAVVAGTAVPGCAVLVALAVAPSLPLLGAALFAFGVGLGTWDVAMNVHGSAVEQRAGRAWMPRYHACWSVGGIAGATVGALAARAAVPVLWHFAVAAGGCAALVLFGLKFFVPAPDPAPADRPDRPSRARVLTARLALVGLITLCATTVEGAAADWLALYLVDVRGTTAAAGAAGYAAFACAMAAGRFAGTPITERLGRDGAVRAGGLTSAAGVALTVLGPATPLAFAGAALWALGISLVFPAAMSAGGEQPDRPADAIAAVATIGYGGFLLGPPLIGVLADHAGLDRALLVLPLLAATIAVLAPATRSRVRHPAG
jgi:fucose permease